MSELPISTLKSIIFGDDLVELDKSDPDGDSNADIKKFLHDAEVANKVGKSSGATVLLDMSVPDGDVDTGDEPLYKSPRVIPALRKPSGQGFVKVIATIRRVFAGHDEEMNEASEIVTRMRDEERAAMIAQIAAAQ